jgi:hypothetical protein
LRQLRADITSLQAKYERTLAKSRQANGAGND